MSNLEQIQLFGERQIRTAWNDAEEKWYFSVIDIIAAIVETDRPRKYWSDLKRKLTAEGSELSENNGQLKMKSTDGKYDCKNLKWPRYHDRDRRAITKTVVSPFSMKHYLDSQQPELQLGSEERFSLIILTWSHYLGIVV